MANMMLINIILRIQKKKINSKPTYNKYIRTKISSYSENFQANKRLTKDKYHGHSILSLESISEVKSKYFPQTFLDKFFECNSVECNSIECDSVEKHNDSNVNGLFKELVQIVDCSDDDDSSYKS